MKDGEETEKANNNIDAILMLYMPRGVVVGRGYHPSITAEPGDGLLLLLSSSLCFLLVASPFFLAVDIYLKSCCRP